MAHDHSKAGCSECGASGELYLHSKCHPKSPTWTILNTETGMIRVVCAECDKPITEMQLARVN